MDDKNLSSEKYNINDDTPPVNNSSNYSMGNNPTNKPSQEINPTKIYIVDCIMGSGKSSAAINFINQSPPDKKFLVITPYLDEIKRYKQMCGNKHHFKEPVYDGGTKLDNIRELLKQGENVVSTHSLFHRFDHELISNCETLGYTLIMDEVTDVVEEYPITNDDIINLLNNYCYLEESTGRVVWKEECQDYVGKFSDIKDMCNAGSVVLVRNHMLLWLFPIEVFNAFDEVYILTYMFKSQIQSYYYDYCNVGYQYLYVGGDSINNYCFTESSTHHNKYDYSKLIHILHHSKLNIIGKDKYALSKTWYVNNSKTAIMKQLKNNVLNFFHNIISCGSKDVLWCTFKDYKSQLSGKGYTKSFLPVNARATNLYKERTALSYLVNIYFNPMIKGFFQDHNVDVDEDGYALSEMLQWIWRSAIRDGKEIWVYIPSSRMRGLLQWWIDSNNKEGLLHGRIDSYNK